MVSTSQNYLQLLIRQPLADACLVLSHMSQLVACHLNNINNTCSAHDNVICCCLHGVCGYVSKLTPGLHASELIESLLCLCHANYGKSCLTPNCVPTRCITSMTLHPYHVQVSVIMPKPAIEGCPLVCLDMPLVAS